MNEDPTAQQDDTSPVQPATVRPTSPAVQEPTVISPVQSTTQKPATPDTIAAPVVATPLTTSIQSVKATAGQPQYGVSVSQLELNQPMSSRFDVSLKALLVKAFIGLALIGVIFVALVFANVIALQEFSTVRYVNDKGTAFLFDFYSKHRIEKLRSGNTQLVSKVSKAGKFPLTLAISSSPPGRDNSVQGCRGLEKLFDVQNDHLGSTIAVCNGLSGKLLSGDSRYGVYVANLQKNDRNHIVTISQDVSRANISRPSAAQDALTRFGIRPYDEDIKRILSTIKIE